MNLNKHREINSNLVTFCRSSESKGHVTKLDCAYTRKGEK